MGLNWSWNDKIGESIHEWEDGQRYTINIYQGNALMIGIYEYEEDGRKYYNLNDFWSDKEHAERCLGLLKGYDNIYNKDYDKIINFTFFRDKVSNKDLKLIIDLINRGLPEIPILILPHEEKTNE